MNLFLVQLNMSYNYIVLIPVLNIRNLFNVDRNLLVRGNTMYFVLKRILSNRIPLITILIRFKCNNKFNVKNAFPV
jgi:hypothetical protein